MKAIPSNKILSMQMAFMLPAGFEGGFEDAVLTWLVYRKARGYPVREADGFEMADSEKTMMNEAHLILYDKLGEGVKEGKRSVLCYAFAEYDQEAEEWKPLPQ